MSKNCTTMASFISLKTVFIVLLVIATVATDTRRRRTSTRIPQRSPAQSPSDIAGDTFSNCRNVRGNRISCNSRAEFRSIDGTCNNLNLPSLGSANVPLRRILRSNYADGFDTPRGFPGASPVIPPANQVSRVLFPVENGKRRRANGDVSVMFMTFGQFLDHDIALSPHPECNIRDCRSLSSFRYPCFPILFTNRGTRCSPIARSIPVCQRRSTRRQVREQLNTITAFVDGSQIYGSDVDLQERLRTTDESGRLRVSRGNILPFDSTIRDCRIQGGCSLVGDERGDENLALHSMHTLWVREHNRIARELRKLNPRWTGDKLYNNARKIVGGILQKIVFKEWLPKLVNLGEYRGYTSRQNPSITNVFSTAAFRFGHSLIPDFFTLLDRNFDEISPSISLRSAFKTRLLVNRQGIEAIMLGLAGNTSSVVDNKFAFSIARRVLERVEERDADLMAYNIQRGRDHGLPTYGRWLQECGLRAVSTFNELRRVVIPETVDGFRQLYNSPEDIDIFAAGISENRVRGSLIGRTFQCLIKRQFLSLRDGDRFYYENSGVFTAAQKREIERASMARVMCNNLRGIVSIQRNAFESERSSGRRVSCDRIPKLDLRRWRDTN